MVFRYNFFIYFLSGLIVMQCMPLQGGRKYPKTRRPSAAIAAENPVTPVEKEPLEEIAQEAAIVYDIEPAEFQEEQKKNHLCTIRVLLDEHDRIEKSAWDFESEQGFTVSDSLTMPIRGIGFDAPTLTIGHSRGVLYVNGRRCSKKQIHLIPHNGTIRYGNHSYHGSMMIIAHENSWLLINVLDLEDYIYSVLQSESWPGWPLEVNKVFAVSSRTYAIAMMVRSNAKKLPYHLRNTNVHQTYEGVHENADLRRAVEKTKGVFIGHHNKPILAMFDSCCGGIIPAHIRDFDFSKAPYLAREYPCTHCKRCKIYHWEVEYSMDQLERIFKTDYPHLSKIKSLEVSKRDKAGLVDKIAIGGKKQNASITGKKLYSLLKDVKSFCFDIQMRNNTVRIKGRGYGHHLGLCQWGAREMVRDGSDYRSILKFYYPGTCFMTLA